MKTLGVAAVRAIVFVVEATVLAALIVSCSRPSSQPEPYTSEDPDKPRVALVKKSLANEFFKTMEDSAARRAA